MNFITVLPKSEGCTAIMVVTDRLSKGTIFIPLDGLTTEKSAWGFICHVVHQQSLPQVIVSDRGT